MEKFYFEKPSIERKNEIIEYLDEFVKNNSDICGAGSLDKIYDGYTFEEALERCERDPWDGEMTNVYWIDVNESLEKYKSTYEQFVADNSELER